MANVFQTSLSLISSTELVQSGIIEALIYYLTDTSMSGKWLTSNYNYP
jgi:hypothetical protein